MNAKSVFLFFALNLLNIIKKLLYNLTQDTGKKIK